MGEHEEFWRFSWASVKTLRLKKPARWRVFFSARAPAFSASAHSKLGIPLFGCAGVSGNQHLNNLKWARHIEYKNSRHDTSEIIWSLTLTRDFPFHRCKGDKSARSVAAVRACCGLVVQHQHDLWWSDRRHWCLSKTSADLLEANFIKISRHFTPVCWTNLETPFSAQSLQRGQWNDQNTPCTCTIKHIKTLQLLRRVPFYNLLQLLHVTEVQDKAFRFAGNFHPMDPMVLEYSARPETAGCNPGPTLAAIISNIQPWCIS